MAPPLLPLQPLLLPPVLLPLAAQGGCSRWLPGQP